MPETKNSYHNPFVGFFIRGKGMVVKVRNWAMTISAISAILALIIQFYGSQLFPTKAALAEVKEIIVAEYVRKDVLRVELESLKTAQATTNKALSDMNKIIVEIALAVGARTR